MPSPTDSTRPTSATSASVPKLAICSLRMAEISAARISIRQPLSSPARAGAAWFEARRRSCASRPARPARRAGSDRPLVASFTVCPTAALSWRSTLASCSADKRHGRDHLGADLAPVLGQHGVVGLDHLRQANRRRLCASSPRNCRVSGAKPARSAERARSPGPAPRATAPGCGSAARRSALSSSMVAQPCEIQRRPRRARPGPGQARTGPRHSDPPSPTHAQMLLANAVSPAVSRLIGRQRRLSCPPFRPHPSGERRSDITAP